MLLLVTSTPLSLRWLNPTPNHAKQITFSTSFDGGGHIFLWLIMEMSTLWIAALTMATSVLGWILREKAAELQRITILLNRTREEIAKEYVTKNEVHADINRVLDRIDKLGEKLDRMMEMKNAQ
jgi:hypothetical protein